jgi:hypothetical protein
MKITLVNNSHAHFEFSNGEIKLIQNIFAEVKNVLNYEPEFQTRVGSYYEEVQKLTKSLNTDYIASLKEIIIINNIMNEACNGINIKDFDNKIGISKIEAKSYLRTINKVMNDLYSSSQM